MKKILLFTFLFFTVSFAASAQLAQRNTAPSSFRYHKKMLKVFPNPATEYIQLEDASQSVATIVIYNIVGKKIKTFQVEDGKKYYLDRFAKGMYLVQLVGSDNKTISTQRLNVRKP